MSDELVKSVIADLEDLPLPLCHNYMYEGIRHLVRNCSIEQCDDDKRLCDIFPCNIPGKHDGDRIARLINAIPDLVNEIARLKHEIKTL